MSVSAETMSAIRFGTGIRPGEKLAGGPDDLMAQIKAGLAETPAFPPGGLSAKLAKIDEIGKASLEARAVRADGDRATYRVMIRKIRRQAFRALLQDRHRRFQQAVFSPNGFYERLAWFWVDHFSVSARKGVRGRLLSPTMEVQAIRPHLAGPFATLLKKAVLHPAMLHYLDQTKSVGPHSPMGLTGRKGLNENLGRELLELHTLGAGNGYVQADVRAAALLLTGMNIDRQTGIAEFRRRIAEPGPIRLLGVDFAGPIRREGDIETVLDHLAGLDITARHICTKLATHFIADQPPQAIVDAMFAAWRGSDGDLSAVYRAMLAHPDAWQNFGAKARQPFDFIVAGLRALDVPVSALAFSGLKGKNADALDEPDNAQADMNQTGTKAPAMDGEDDDDETMAMMAPKEIKAEPGNPITVAAAARMGQPVWEPQSPAGWEENFDVWITSSQLAQRIGWARAVAEQFGKNTDPRDFVRNVLADAARDDTIMVARQAPSRAAGIAFVLASPEFNRR